MRTNPTKSGNSTLKVVGQVCAVTTGLAFFSPCEALQFPAHACKQSKHANHPQDLWHATAFRVGEQRFIPNGGGAGDDDYNLDGEITLRSYPVEEFFINSDIVSVTDNDSRNDLELFLEDVYYID